MRYRAAEKLKKLSETPFNLKGLSAERINSFISEACGYKLLYGTESIDEDGLQALTDLAQEANCTKKMESMQKGEVINKIEGFPSEERAVLHTAMRDFFQEPMAPEATKLALAENDKLKAFSWDRFTDMVMVGIGGSDLGPRALYLALAKFWKEGRRVHFISNVDPDDAALAMQGLDLKKTCVVIVSKSGTTLETLTNETLVREHFVQAGLNANEHCIAVTGQGSPMDDPARYLESFYIWDYVGGRYSATSMVGGVMLAFGIGHDNYWELLRGASEMDRVALKSDVKENLPLLSALLGVWNRNFLGHATVAIIPYSQALSRFPAHLQQCDMESNGKHINKRGETVEYGTGPIIWGEPGTNGQHSFFQLLHQGTEIVPVEFIGFKDSQFEEDMNVEGTTSQEKLLANLFAQSVAMATGQDSDNPNKQFEGNRPNSILLGEKLTPYSLGALLAYYEHKVAFQGFIWDINSFDQEGVQLGKVLAKQFLELFKGEGSYPIGEAYLKQLGFSEVN